MRRRTLPPPVASTVYELTPAGEVSVHVKGRHGGTVVTAGEGPADLTVMADAWTVMGVMACQVDAREAMRSGLMRDEGIVRLVPLITEFFDASPAPVGSPLRRPGRTTCFTAPEYGKGGYGGRNWAHAGGHLIGIVVFPLLFWVLSWPILAATRWLAPRRERPAGGMA